MKANIANMTPEQREENRQKGVEVRKAKIELAKATRAMADLYQAIGQWEGEDE